MPNPAKPSAKSRYKQGYYQCVNRSKYIGDVDKIVYRSSWELKVCRFFDLSEKIIAWCCEPDMPVIYISPKDGLPHRYYPDFLTVTINNGEKQVTLYEVKPYKELFKPSPKGKKKSRYIKECLTYEINTAKWKYAEALCKKKGWKFVKLTEKEIYGKLNG